MFKIFFTILIASVLIATNTMADKIDCTEFEKISAKYLECKTINLKRKSKKFRLKAVIEAEVFKEKITRNAKDGKKRFDKSTLKEKLIKLKNSKTLTQFMEK